MNWYKTSQREKFEMVPPFARSMPYPTNQNWYEEALYQYNLHKEAGMKEGILAFLLSILSSISLTHEANAIKNVMLQKNIPIEQQQKIVQTVNSLTDQNKTVEELTQNDITNAVKKMEDMKIVIPPMPKQEDISLKPSFPSNINENSPIISTGKYILNNGFRVTEHPNFSQKGFDPTGHQPVHKVHVGKSKHYTNQALDISGKNKQELSALYHDLFNRRHELGIVQMIYNPVGQWFGQGDHPIKKPYKGHNTHIHIAFSKPGMIKEINKNQDLAKNIAPSAIQSNEL